MFCCSTMLKFLADFPRLQSYVSLPHSHWVAFALFALEAKEELEETRRYT